MTNVLERRSSSPPGITTLHIADQLRGAQAGLQELGFQEGALGLTADERRQKAALQERQRLYDAINDTATPLQNRMRQNLEFAQPPSLNIHTLDETRKMGLTLLSVPRFPARNRKELADIAFGAETPIRDIYGRDFLRAAINGVVALPDMDTGHYTFIDSPETKTNLSEALGINDLNTASMDDVFTAIATNGKAVLKELGLGQNAYIRVITAEEAMLMRTFEKPTEDADSVTITGSKVRRTDQYVALQENQVVVRDDTGELTHPRLAIALGAPQARYYLNIPKLPPASPK